MKSGETWKTNTDTVFMVCMIRLVAYLQPTGGTANPIIRLMNTQDFPVEAMIVNLSLARLRRMSQSTSYLPLFMLSYRPGIIPTSFCEDGRHQRHFSPCRTRGHSLDTEV
jgi:hypothetical protein